MRSIWIQDWMRTLSTGWRPPKSIRISLQSWSRTIRFPKDNTHSTPWTAESIQNWRSIALAIGTLVNFKAWSIKNMVMSCSWVSTLTTNTWTTKQSLRKLKGCFLNSSIQTTMKRAIIGNQEAIWPRCFLHTYSYKPRLRAILEMTSPSK